MITAKRGVWSMGVLLVIAGCVGASPGDGSGGASHVPHRLVIGDVAMTVPLPGKESRDFVAPPIIGEINRSEIAALPEDGVVLLESYWDYPRGRRILGSSGALKLVVRVLPFVDGYSYSAHTPDDLDGYVLGRLKATYDSLNADYIREGQASMVVQLPTKFFPVTIGTLHGLRYSYGGDRAITESVVPLSSNHYVRIHYSYIDNSNGQRPALREQALRDAEAIVSKISFERLSRPGFPGGSSLERMEP